MTDMLDVLIKAKETMDATIDYKIEIQASGMKRNAFCVVSRCSNCGELHFKPVITNVCGYEPRDYVAEVFLKDTPRWHQCDTGTEGIFQFESVVTYSSI